MEYSGLPGNQQDWITLVKASAAKNTYGDWFYTKGVNSGQHTFGGLSPGRYEARVYVDWPAGGFNIKARHAFTVAAGPFLMRP